MRSRISNTAAGACVSSRKWPASKMWASILVSAASMRGSRRDRRRRHAVPWAIGRLNGRHLYQEAFVGEGQDRLALQDGPGALLVGIRARPGQQYKEISPATEAPAETQEPPASDQPAAEDATGQPDEGEQPLCAPETMVDGKYPPASDEPAAEPAAEPADELAAQEEAAPEAATPDNAHVCPPETMVDGKCPVVPAQQ